MRKPPANLEIDPETQARQRAALAELRERQRQRKQITPELEEWKEIEF